MKPPQQPECDEGSVVHDGMDLGARKEERFPCPVATVVYLRDDRWADQHDVAWLVNLSRRGLAFLSSRPFEPGDVVRTRVQVPGLEEIEMEARVAHCRPRATWGYLVGCSLADSLTERKVGLAVTVPTLDELDPSCPDQGT
jgi:hypothetical protein